MVMKILTTNDITQYKTIGDVWGFDDNVVNYRFVIDNMCEIDNEFYLKLKSIPDFEMTINDIVYHFGQDEKYLSRSGDKLISNLVKRLLTQFGLEEDDGKYVPSYLFYNTIAYTLLSQYKRKWIDLIDTYSIEFDALKPFNMSSHDEILSDHLESDNNNASQNAGQSIVENSHYGFNSSNASPVDRDNSSDNSSSSRTEHYERDNTREREITRSGNIGNKSNQELMKQQRDMLNWIFFDTMFKDLDRVLAFPKMELSNS